jgi:hypothetical protein
MEFITKKGKEILDTIQENITDTLKMLKERLDQLEKVKEV